MRGNDRKETGNDRRSSTFLTDLPMDVPLLLWKTILLRAYVFFFLAVALFAASNGCMGWRCTGTLIGVKWLTVFVCELSWTRIGLTFGDHYYTAFHCG